jgi:hypothetical protein
VGGILTHSQRFNSTFHSKPASNDAINLPKSGSNPLKPPFKNLSKTTTKNSKKSVAEVQSIKSIKEKRKTIENINRTNGVFFLLLFPQLFHLELISSIRKTIHSHNKFSIV